MCGFAGIFKNTPIEQPDICDLEKMSECIKHRGPDDSQKVVDTNCALAFRRLSIIDLEKGVQPFTDETGRYTGIFNGEIYNVNESISACKNNDNCWSIELEKYFFSLLINIYRTISSIMPLLKAK